MSDRSAKYIIWDDGLADCAIVFNNHLNHANMASALNIVPISAGFVSFESTLNDGSIKVITFGESVSLKLKSRPEDVNLIKFTLSLK